MRVVAIVQARLASTRLPGKVLAMIGRHTMLERVVQRAFAIPGVDRVVVACPLTDVQALSTGAYTLMGYGGDPSDLLDRYDYVASVTDADIVLRITADCPLLDPVLSGLVLRQCLGAGPCAVASNAAPNTDGFETEAFEAKFLRLATLEATDPKDREHVVPWMWANGIQRRVEVDGEAPKLSVDTAEDLERVRAICRELNRVFFSRQEAIEVWRNLQP